MKRRKIFVTANLERNLDGLESFHTESPSAFEKLLRRINREVLTRFVCNRVWDDCTSKAGFRARSSTG